MKTMFWLLTLLYCAGISLIANSYVLLKEMPLLLLLWIPVFLFINIFAGMGIPKTNRKRLRVCCHGAALLCVFYISMIVSTIWQLTLAVRTIPEDYMTFVWSAVLCIAVNGIIFWNGIVCIYLTSVQLGIKKRVIGAVCGMIPLVNLIVLADMIRTVIREYFFEIQKEQLNMQRREQKICQTRYPILLVHGVFFRDTKFFNYWGRIPKELERNGATIFYGNHPSASSVADSAQYLKERIAQVLRETGAEKVNIIAHSKGGLDCRYAIAKLGVGDSVASLITINTPHKGCLFADYLLEKVSPDFQNKVAQAYNTTLKNLGETNADFLAAVYDLTDARCQQRNEEMPVPENIYCQSIGSVMRKARGGKFPLNISYHLAKHFDGENDGLVSANSFQWGENPIILRPAGRRGISHGDMIDLNRENIRGFDVREFYVQLVNKLKNKGF